jgi:flagellar protein FlaG
MNIAPATAGTLPAAVHDVSGRQPEAPVTARQQVSAVQAEAEVDKTGTASEEVDPAELQQRVNELNAVMKQHASSIEFSVDDESGRTIVKVVDTDTDTVLQQYPSRELLAISRQIDKFQGMFIKTQA